MRVYLKKYRNAIVYALTIVFSLVYIILGNRIASRNFYFGSVSTLEYSARVLRVVDIQEENYTLSGTDNQITNEIITFEAMVTSGSLKGITVTATQQRDSIIAVMPERVEGVLPASIQSPAALISRSLRARPMPRSSGISA